MATTPLLSVFEPSNLLAPIGPQNVEVLFSIGNELTAEEKIQCRFCAWPPVDAELVEGDVYKCPTRVITGNAARVPFNVLIDDEVIEKADNYYFDYVPVLNNVAPLAAVANSGDSVTVSLSAAVHMSQTDVQCKFGDDLMPAMFSADVGNNVNYACYSPVAEEQKTVPFDVLVMGKSILFGTPMSFEQTTAVSEYVMQENGVSVKLAVKLDEAATPDCKWEPLFSTASFVSSVVVPATKISCTEYVCEFPESNSVRRASPDNNNVAGPQWQLSFVLDGVTVPNTQGSTDAVDYVPIAPAPSSSSAPVPSSSSAPAPSSSSAPAPSSSSAPAPSSSSAPVPSSSSAPVPSSSSAPVPSSSSAPAPEGESEEVMSMEMTYDESIEIESTGMTIIYAAVGVSLFLVLVIIVIGIYFCCCRAPRVVTKQHQQRVVNEVILRSVATAHPVARTPQRPPPVHRTATVVSI